MQEANVDLSNAQPRSIDGLRAADTTQSLELRYAVVVLAVLSWQSDLWYGRAREATVNAT